MLLVLHIVPLLHAPLLALRQAVTLLASPIKMVSAHAILKPKAI